MKVLLPLLIAAALGTVAAPAAHADTNDNWVVRFGGSVVDPKSNNGTLADARASVSSSVRPSASLEYMITPNIGVDLLAAWPFQHDVKLSGLGKVAQTKELPPTLGVNYHFLPNAAVWVPCTAQASASPTAGAWPPMPAWTSSSVPSGSSPPTCVGSTSKAT